MSEEQQNDVVDSVEETQQEVQAIDPKQFEELQAENERLKAFHDKVTQEKKEAVAKAKAEADEIAREKAEKEGDYKKLLALKESEYTAQIDELKQSLADRDAADKRRLLNDEAMKIATELSKTSMPKAVTLKDILVKRLKLTEDGIKVVDENGEYLKDGVNALKEFAKKEYDFLCDGLQSTGGAGVFKSTENAQDLSKLSPIDRINAARGLN